jgi:hypothetical protein
MTKKTQPDRVAIDIAHGLIDAVRESAYLTDNYFVQRNLHNSSPTSFIITADNGDVYRVSVERVAGGAAEAVA